MWHSVWYTYIYIYIDILCDILSDIFSDILYDILSDCLTYILIFYVTFCLTYSTFWHSKSGIPFGILKGMLSVFAWHSVRGQWGPVWGLARMARLDQHTICQLALTRPVNQPRINFHFISNFMILTWYFARYSTIHFDTDLPGLAYLGKSIQRNLLHQIWETDDCLPKHMQSFRQGNYLVTNVVKHHNNDVQSKYS